MRRHRGQKAVMKLAGLAALIGWNMVPAASFDAGRRIEPASRIILPSMFSENMVLQRDVPIPVWGWAPDGMAITVTIADQTASTIATNGRWRVRLPPLPAGGPYTFRVESPGDYHYDTILFSQVRVGDVWLVAGDMNVMEAVMDSADALQATADSATNTTVRIFMAGYRPASAVSNAQEILMGFWGRPKWEAASYTVPRSSRNHIPGGSSALSWYFARALARHLRDEVPLGMIELSSLVPVEAWVAPAAPAGHPGADARPGVLPPAPGARAFLANIAPLAPFPIRGAVLNVSMGMQPPPHEVLPALARSWRAAWADESLPILFVQAPGFMTNDAALARQWAVDGLIPKPWQNGVPDHARCAVRESQWRAWKSLAHSGLAVTFDLGEPFRSRTARQREIAERLVLQARAVAYGETNLVAGGPEFTACRFDGRQAIINFSSVGSGLETRGGVLKGFELSADGNVFHPAAATIEGNTVVATCPKLQVIMAVRYAWAGCPAATLYNREGLPAAPFRFTTGTFKDRELTD